METRSIKTLLSQGAAGGVCGTFLMMCVLMFAYPREDSFAWAFTAPIFVVWGAGIGMAAGAAMWALEKGVERNWRILSRVAVSTLFKVPLFLLLSYVQKFDQRTLYYRYTAVILFGLAILLMTSSNIRPWRMIAWGTSDPSRLKTLFSQGPIRISRKIQEPRDTFLAGMPLRAASLFALMISILIAIGSFSFSWWNEWSFESTAALAEGLALTAYFGATVVVSFAARSKWLVAVTAALVNVPWASWMLSDSPRLNSVAPAFVVCFFVSFWLLFVTGVMVRPVRKGDLHVDYGHTEIRFGKRQWVKESQ